MIGLKSILSCLAGARLILIVHMICCNMSARIDNFAYFLLNPILCVEYCEARIILNPVKSIPTKICLVPLLQWMKKLSYPELNS